MNEIQQRILFEQVGYAIEDVKQALLQSIPQPVSRRERIATAALQGLLAADLDREQRDPCQLANEALVAADALIAELDKPAQGQVAP